MHSSLCREFGKCDVSLFSQTLSTVYPKCLAQVQTVQTLLRPSPVIFQYPYQLSVKCAKFRRKGNKQLVHNATFFHYILLKIINNLCGLDPANFFTFAPSTLTRGHEFKLIKSICRNNWLLNFYSNRVVNFWNSLPPDVVNARTFNIFVNKLNCIDVSRFCHLGRA